MIISASRRTDIPAFFSEWFFKRLEEKYVYVRNSFNPHQISSINLSPEVVDGIVFWTKNAIPMLSQLERLAPYPYYFHWTVNPYGCDIEPSVPSKNNVLIPGFKKLADKIGSERVIWRYNPIVFTSKYTVDYHLCYFEKLSRRLSGYTDRCVVSFLDYYENTRQNMKRRGLKEISDAEKTDLIGRFAQIAQSYDIDLEMCVDTQKPAGVKAARCVDRTIFEKILGCSLSIEKDPGERPECRCLESVDIGMYDTCSNGCLYCYANHHIGKLLYHQKCHDPNSPLLMGKAGEDDVIKERKVKSHKDRQIKFLI